LKKDNRPVGLAALICGEMAVQGSPLVGLAALICGEMAVQDVPLAQGVDLEALKAGDDDPLEVVVEVPAGKSKRGWRYTEQALRDIVGEVMSNTLNGFLGHQKPEDIDHQFPPPVTHWVGAMFQNGRAYFRGVIDAAAKDLKRWIRAKRVRQVSIYGAPTLRQTGGETQVIGYKPLSIDWTPLDRAGMPTRVVAVGEMDVITEGGDEHVDKTMTPQELLAKLREFLQSKQLNVSMIAGELGWQATEVARQIDEDWTKRVTGEMETLKKVREALGVPDDGDVVAAAKRARAGLEAQAKAEREKTIDKVLGEMVTSEPARPLIKRMLQVPETADEEAIKKAVGEMVLTWAVRPRAPSGWRSKFWRPHVGEVKTHEASKPGPGDHHIRQPCQGFGRQYRRTPPSRLTTSMS